MAKSDVELIIGAEVNKAAKEIKKFASDSSKSLKSVESGMKALKIAGAAVAGIFAGRALVNGIRAVTAAAIVQEDAVQKLNTSLRLAGDFTEEASIEMQNFASALQNTSTVGDETSLNMLALAKTFDLTNEQAQELVTAAADLAAVTNLSLDSAVINLGKSFSGLSGELGESVTGIRDLSEAQLKAGGAIDLVRKRFDGAAEAMTKTFGGALTQLNNTFGDFHEALGAIITQNPVFIKLINETSAAFVFLADIIKQNQDTIIEFVNDGLFFAVKALELLFVPIKALAQGFHIVDIAAQNFILTLLNIEFVETLILSFVNAPKLLGNAFVEMARRIVAAFSRIPFASEVFKQLGVDIEATGEHLAAMNSVFIRSLDTKTVSDMKARVRSIRDESRDALNGIDNLFKGIGDSVDDIFGATTDAKKAVENLGGVKAGNPFKDVIENAKEAAKITAKGGVGKDDGPGGKEFVPFLDRFAKLNGIASKLIFGLPTLVATFVEALADTAAEVTGSFIIAFGKGASGAKDLLTSGATAIGTIFGGPAAGAFLGGLADVLSQEPEALQASIKEFTETFPQLISNIAENMDVIVESLIKFLLEDGGLEKIAGAILRALVSGFRAFSVGIAVAVSHAIGKAFQNERLVAFGEKVGVIFDRASRKFVDGIVGVLVGIRETFASGFEPIFRGLIEVVERWGDVIADFFSFELKEPKWVKDLIAAFTSEGQKVKKGKGQFERAIGINIPGVAFATGGVARVRGSGGTDSVPALVSPGEMFVDQTTTKRLDSFLGNAEGQNLQVMTLLNGIVQLLQQPMQVQAKADLNGQTLANIILELNRQNARLA